MNSIDFEKANVTLGAGNNPNTRPLRIAICNNAQMPDYRQGFLISKWMMDDNEKAWFRQKLKAIEIADDKIESIIDLIPPVFLSCMHSMSPVMVFNCEEMHVINNQFMIPDKDAANAVNSKRVSDN